MTYAIAAFTPPSIPIVDADETYPVRRVFCIGRNYADHAREMGHDPDREPPFFFEKHPSCIVSGEGTLDFPYPPMTEDVHHEVELVVALGAGGRDLSIAGARNAIFGYAVGIDFTRRDLQAEAKASGRPWATAKSFDYSAPCSAIIRAEEVEDIDGAKIALSKNDNIVQQGRLDQMIWPVPDAISYLSKFFTLHAGDLIMTGTPAGVGPVVPGDLLAGNIEGVGELRVRCNPS